MQNKLSFIFVSLLFLLVLGCGSSNVNDVSTSDLSDNDVTFENEGEVIGSYTVGQKVYGNWHINNWYSGRISGECDFDFYEISFDNGNVSCHPEEQVTEDVVPSEDKLVVGADVIVEADEEFEDIPGIPFVRGTIESVDGADYNIETMDGSSKKASAEEIRLVSS